MKRPRYPAWYPTAILAAFVFAYVEASGVSPWAGIRLMAIAVAMGLFLTLAASAMLRDRDRGAFVALILGLLLAAGGLPWMALLLTLVLGLVLFEALVARRRPTLRWPLVTRALGTLTAILILAILIRTVQDGRGVGMATELLAEAPGHLTAPWTTASAAEAVVATPDVYLLLLDGYPRADKLLDRFGIDNMPFVDALRSRGFTVAARSRSNYPATRMTLASMFNGTHVSEIPFTERGTPGWRRAIDEGTQLEVFRSAGYRVVSISSGYEDASLRQADEFIDTGQVGELERVFLALSLARAVAPDQLYGLLIRNHGERTKESFDAAMRVVLEGGPPRFTFVHIGSPHGPLALTADGSPIAAERTSYPFDDAQDAASLGPDYSRLLEGQIQYLNKRTLALVDAIHASRRDAIVAVFSDHGSGVDFSDSNPLAADLDLRTANLLAVSAPLGLRLIDDRSTLVNLLGRIAHNVLGAPFREAPEEIRVYPDELGPYVTFDPPD